MLGALVCEQNGFGIFSLLVRGSKAGTASLRVHYGRCRSENFGFLLPTGPAVRSRQTSEYHGVSGLS